MIRPAEERGSPSARYKVLSLRTIVWCGALVVLVGAGFAVWLLSSYGDAGDDVTRNQLDAIRTAGTLVIGTGGAFALLLAARRQRSTEIALQQKDLDQQHQLRVALATEEDAAARRITDLYTKAAESLGSDKAPVRLAGVYALERVAQDNDGQRQTIVNLLCAYLRMPFDLPGDDTDGQPSLPLDSRQELEVRVAVQRVLVKHLDPGDDADDPVDTFWAHMELDFTGATLLNLDFRGCHVDTAQFRTARFRGFTQFAYSRFHAADFDEASFDDDALFNRTTFLQVASFHKAHFARNLWFEEATFAATTAMFGGSVFDSVAKFTRTQFSGGAYFDGARFNGAAAFDRAQLDLLVKFNDVEFRSRASFTGTTFSSLVTFDRTRFTGTSENVPPQPDEDSNKEPMFFPIGGLTTYRFGDDSARRIRENEASLPIVRFDKARFGMQASFRDTYFASSVTFAETDFHDRPPFGWAHFECGMPAELTDSGNAP